jgi:hypothetical protein
VTLFLAQGEHHSARVLEDARLGWRDVASGGLEVRCVSGTHDSMFAEANARELARELEPLLE